MLGYLERCVASVADQETVRVEHLIMDGGSRDGTAEWLAARPWLISEVRRDNGMYEAINRGFRRACGRVVAHLNCDEQYLPGTLATAVRYFDAHPEVDVVFGDTLTVRPDGSLVAYRKTVRPLWPACLLPPLHVTTPTTFFRRKLVDDGVLYDDSYKDIADLVRIVGLIQRGYRLVHLRRYLSIFTLTGTNRSFTVSTIDDELERFMKDLPWWVRRLRHQWRLLAWAQKMLSGCYLQARPLEYAIYAPGQLAARTQFVEPKPSFRYRRS